MTCETSLAIEYTRIVQKSGPDSSEAQAFLDQHHEDAQFMRRAKTINKLAKLKGRGQAGVTAQLGPKPHTPTRIRIVAPASEAQLKRIRRMAEDAKKPMSAELANRRFGGRRKGERAFL